MKSENNSLDSIIFISLPESFQADRGDMPLDPSILLPVEVPQGISPREWQMENLNWEMILSGMLKILAADPSHEHASYYRNFILTVKPQIVQELTQSAIVKSQTRHYELAEEIFKALAGLQPDELRHRLNLAILYDNKGGHWASLGREDEAEQNRDLAEDAYLRLLDEGEALPDIYFNAAWFFFYRRDFSRAAELLNSYLPLSEDETKKSEARKLLKEAEGLKDREGLYKEAYELILRDQNREGVQRIEAFLQENPEVWNGWFLKGWALRKLADYPAALEAFEKARERGSVRVEVLNEMAICLLELEEYSRCEALLNEAFEAEPENIKVISNMGILALKRGRKDEAAGFFDTVLELEPEDPIALEYRDFLKKS